MATARTKPLTRHQRTVLAALDDLARERELIVSDPDCDAEERVAWRHDGSEFFLRSAIGQRAGGNYRGIARKTMHALRSMCLVEPESELTMHLVETGVCHCGCDRWKITEAGTRLVLSWNVVDLDSRRAGI